jgi:hypothetical protein
MTSVLKKISILFISFALILTLPVFSQGNKSEMQRLAVSIDSLSRNSPSELIYIQTSKGIYETLEDVWFKAYVLNSHTFVPSSLSQTLYLTVQNEFTGNIVWQESYEIQSGFAEGRVFLADSLADGNYLLIATTPYSLLKDSAEIKSVRRIEVRKQIKIGNNGLEETGPAPLSVRGMLQFNTFPEGGNLVSGIQSNLAFKAVTPDGLPEEIRGTLFEDTIPLVQFQSIHAGMGGLSFTPQRGKKYYIKLTRPASDSVFLLPEIQPMGLGLKLINRDKDFLYFSISQSSSLGKQVVYLRGQVRGMVCCMAKALLDREATIKIPLKEFLQQGIAEFTLFDAHLVPVAERLVYVNPNKKLYIEAQADKDKYQTREKAILKITVKDENGEPVIASLGISIFDKLYQMPNDPVNILSHCYLSSQLKGKIFDPAYYFDPKNDNREQALDLLLLTQGWRRYIWNEEELKQYGKTNTLFSDGVEGKVYATKKEKQAWGAQQIVMAFNPGTKNESDLIVADSTGRFMVNPVHLKTWQGGYVYLKPMAPEEFQPRINLTDPFTIINDNLKNKKINIPVTAPLVVKTENSEDLLVEGRGTIKLAEVTVKAHGVKAFRDKYIGQLDSLAKFKYNSDYVCWECGHFSEKSPPSKGQVLVLNCKFHTTDQSHKPEEGRTYGVRYGENLADKTYKYDKLVIYHNSLLDFTEEELLKMNNLTRVKAYYAQREFYQPKYDTDTLENLTTDFRNTLLWAPSVNTDEKGEATVEFFCSDINTTFKGTIEGVNGDGLLGTGELEFRVLKIPKKQDNL